MDVNIMQTLDTGKRNPRNFDPTKLYWLPAKFNTGGTSDRVDEEWRRDVLQPYVERACAAAGFNIMMRGWEKSKSAAPFVCNRYRVHPTANKEEMSVGDQLMELYTRKDHNKKNNKKKGKKGKKGKPDVKVPVSKRSFTKEGKCSFNFLVYWHAGVKRWYMPKLQTGCGSHCGHIRLPPYLLRHRAKTIGKEAIERSCDAFSVAVKAAGRASNQQGYRS
jgi:hypothetical protein